MIYIFWHIERHFLLNNKTGTSPVYCGMVKLNYKLLLIVLASSSNSSFSSFTLF